jgi:hypothetical protein
MAPQFLSPEYKEDRILTSIVLLVLPLSVLLMYGAVNLLLKVRELLADARVRIHAPSSVVPLRRAMTSLTWRRPQSDLDGSRLGFLENTRAYSAFMKIFPHHPKVTEREACLDKDPELLKRTIPLSVMTGSMLGYFGLALIETPILPMILLASAILLGLIINSVVLLPEHCTGLVSIRRTLLSNAKVAFLFSIAGALSFLLIHLMPRLLVLQVDIGNIGLQLFAVALLCIALGLFLTLSLSFHSLLRAVILRWYGLGLVRRHPNLFLLALPISVTVAPLIALYCYEDSPMVSFASVGFTIGLCLLVLVLHLRYANRCPGCSSRVKGRFVLGCQCPKCHYPLNNWLRADSSAGGWSP